MISNWQPRMRRGRSCASTGDPVFWGLCVWFTAWWTDLSGLVFQLVPYLRSIGVETASIVIAAALIGSMQFVGRLTMMAFGEWARLSLVGAPTTTLSLGAAVILLVSPPQLGWLILFAVAFGITNGVTIILRGVAPAEWGAGSTPVRPWGRWGRP